MTELLERMQAEALTVALPPGYAVEVFEADPNDAGQTCLGIDLRQDHGDFSTGEVQLIPWVNITDGFVKDRIELMILESELDG